MRVIKNHTIIFMSFTALLLTGCGDKRQSIDSYGNENSITATETDAAKEEVNIEPDLITWNEQYEIGGSHIIVEADFTDRSNQTYSLVKSKIKTYTAEEKKFYLEKLSDGTDIYYGEEEYLPKEYWKTFVDNWEYEYDYMKNIGYSASELEYIRETLDMYNEKYINAYDDYVPAESFEGDMFIIKKYGQPYFISFLVDRRDTLTNEDEIENSGIYMYSIYTDSLLPDCYERSDAKNGSYYHDIINSMDYPYGMIDNDCTLDESEIEKLAYDYLNRMGINGFKIYSKKDIVWYESNGGVDNVVGYNGCRVTLYKTCDDEFIIGGEQRQVEIYDSELDETYDYVFSYGPEQIMIDIDDRGVLEFNYKFSTTEMEVVSDSTSILGAAAVKSSFESLLQNYIPNDYYIDVTMDRIEFGYINLINPEDSLEFTSVPAYVFYPREWYKPLAINAIDGSMIAFGGDYY